MQEVDDDYSNEYYLNNHPKNFKIISCLIILIITGFIIRFSEIDLTNIPELKNYSNQALKVLYPSNKCRFITGRTLFFPSDLRNNTKDIENEYNIKNYKNKRNSYVTYYLGDEEYYQYEKYLDNLGLIRSKEIYADNNFFLSKRAVNLLRNSGSSYNINSLRKYYRLFGYLVFLKKEFYFQYTEMKKRFNDDYDFMPETYSYPKDKDIIYKKFENYTLSFDNLWFVKPTNSFGGKGIKIFRSLDKIKDKEEYILNKYIVNLDLINNKKYDFRLYILVTGLKPLRIYLNQEGLIRIASQNFSLTKQSLGDKYVHLTNTGINSNSKNFIVPNNDGSEEANIWNFHTYANYLKRKKVDYNKIRDKIKDIVIKSMISVYQNLTEELDKNNLNDINFFDILGFDIIITDEYEPILLEINSGPSTTMYNKLDKPIKTNLFADSLNIAGISIFSKNVFNKKDNSFIKVEDRVNNAFCELDRPRGDFELIFPLKENINIYEKFFKGINSIENTLFWKRILKNS